MPVFAVLLEEAAVLFGTFARGVAARASAYAATLFGEAVGGFVESTVAKVVPQNLASFASKGANFLRNIMTGQVNAKQIAKNMRFDVVSFSSITPDVVQSKIQDYFSQRIDSIRADNPEFNIQNIVKDTSYSRSSSHRAEGGFIDFSDSMKVFEKSINDIVRIEGQSSANIMRRQLMMYPQQRAGSLYDRTFELRHGWEIGTVSFNASDIFSGDVMSPPSNMATSVSFSNAVPYTKWVQRRSTQSAYHRGRWNTVEDVAEMEGPNLELRIDNALKVILGD